MLKEDNLFSCFKASEKIKMYMTLNESHISPSIEIIY